MGIHTIKMPDVGEGITEAEIVEWNVSVGDLVREDQLLAAVMTDKATVEIPSPVEGKILTIDGEVGAMTAVGATIITINVENGDGSVEEAPSLQPAKASETDQEKMPPETRQDVAENVKPSVPMSPPVEARTPMAAPSGAPRPEGERPIAAPSVRKRARDAGIELVYVRGSGPAGRILHEDLDAYIAGKSEPVSSAFQPNNTITETKVIGLRRKIAERMQDAKARIPHITYVDEVDMTELEDLRQHLNIQRQEGQPKLTLLPFIMRAMVKALKAYPKLSAHFEDDAGILRQFGAAHIGMAVQTANGLVVAVVRNAEARDIWNIASEAQRLADAARDGTITREELTGSTITLSSLGSMGGIVSTPVINSPEVAVVGVNKIAMRPVYQDGAFVPRKMMNLSSSFDHRIVDGWDAAEFIQHIRGSLETPATLFMEP
ncbi:dihydrolipoamide acetyltransferase family protein [Hoeflea prorocentri]|uniref:Dihydrolipoamide acetyltransferase component of pyruvate dehydrogenase complex n=1 Tax=Hoeflea prorocentri TaxID=1922333 RepID=A0A9X3UG55_9HYPH|nr:dihydrolipoamide acetyltransferase family protein [Hoeflea prorocentri]MCY6380733.1 dihydrolipoamide acetyltransferase family protein [Hoeflea prorocentri]MDA5398533.1 dihydrolipoamide acetyltransferase family protein [Hoeflea prorocentri]